jgi:5-keto 4-deoxyuronate isomerase
MAGGGAVRNGSPLVLWTAAATAIPEVSPAWSILCGAGTGSAMAGDSVDCCDQYAIPVVALR